MLKRAVIFSFALVALFAIAGCNGDKKPKRGKNEVVVISYNVDADESTLINRGPLMTDLINTLSRFGRFSGGKAGLAASSY